MDMFDNVVRDVGGWLVYNKKHVFVNLISEVWEGGASFMLPFRFIVLTIFYLNASLCMFYFADFQVEI